VNDPIVKETQALIAADDTKKSGDELAKLLGHADWRVRLEAQYTLAERGAGSIPVLAKVAQSSQSHPLARLHAIWGLGQLAGANPAALTPVRNLLKDQDAEVRAQALKVLGDRRAVDSSAAFIAALKDSSNRVKFFAAQGLGKFKQAEATPALIDALRANNDADNYLRHALVMGLVGSHNLAAMKTAAGDSSRAVRMGVLLAYRRLGLADAAQFLKDSDRLIVREAALAINDAPIAEAMPALAALSSSSIEDEAVLYRVLNARFRLGRQEDATALAEFAARSNAPEKLRAEAINQLALWPKPPARDRIVGVFRPLPEATRDAAVAGNALTAVLPKILAADTPDAVKISALNAVEGFESKGAVETLVAVIRDAKQTGDTRAAALVALAKLDDPRLADLVTLAGQSDSASLRLAALPIAARISPDTAAPLLARLIEQGNAEEQRAAYRTLATFKHPTADALLAAQLKKLSTGGVPAAAQLELLDAAAKRSDPTIKQLLAKRDAALAASDNPLASYLVALEGGNAKRGLRIFYSQPVMACVRCHSFGAGGGDAGPNLAMIGAKHDRTYLLESVVKPSAKIAPGFDSIVVTLKTGGVVGGVVANETADSISLRNADGKTTIVSKADITRREGAPSSMPEIYGAVLTKSELRDVVEFLASLTKPAEDADQGEQPRALRGLK
jgi:quinoprotein glucose dehydrogenase